jgi:acylphosphatase
MTIIARHLMITGRVQGVFYRNWAVEQARGLGLAGWVRNRADGSVEAIVEGAPDAVDRMIGLADEGPPAAKVARIDVMGIEPGGLDKFEKRSTLVAASL